MKGSEWVFFSQESTSTIAGRVAEHVEVVSKSATSLDDLFFPRLMMRGEESEVVSELSPEGLEATTRAPPQAT